MNNLVRARSIEMRLKLLSVLIEFLDPIPQPVTKRKRKKK